MFYHESCYQNMTQQRGENKTTKLGFKYFTYSLWYLFMIHKYSTWCAKDFSEYFERFLLSNVGTNKTSNISCISINQVASLTHIKMHSVEHTRHCTIKITYTSSSSDVNSTRVTLEESIGPLSCLL